MQEGQEFKIILSYVVFFKAQHKKMKENQKGNHLEYVCPLCVYHWHILISITHKVKDEFVTLSLSLLLLTYLRTNTGSSCIHHNSIME